MKSYFVKMIMYSLCAFMFTSVNAQTLNKKTLVSDLNNTEDVTMSEQQKKDYESINNRLADDLVNVDKSEKSQEDRDKEIDKLFDKRDNDVDNIFGKDSKYDDTRKNLKKTSNKMRRKMKLTKLVL